jgi:predicted amino acid dehydrogenase
MPDSGPTLVVEVSLADAADGLDEHVPFLGRDVRILRVGTGGDVTTAEAVVGTWAAEASAIAVTGLRALRPADRHRMRAAMGRITRATPVVPVTDGRALGDVLDEWAIRHVHTELPGYFTNARTVILGGSDHERATRTLRNFTANLEFADPVRRLDLDARVHANPLLGLAVDAGLWPIRRLPHPLRRVPARLTAQVGRAGTGISTRLARRAARDCDVVVATFEELTAFGLTDLTGKTVVTTAVSPDRLADLARRGVDLVLDTTPQPFASITVPAAVLEAMMLALVSSHERMTDDDLLDMIVAAGLEPRLLYPNGPRRKSRFAFVIHPLSQRFFRKVEPLGTIARFSPPLVMDVVEKALAYLPPMTYSHVTGITSPTGAQAEGWLITVGGTPKELMAHRPEFTYARLLEAAEMAKKLGAQVMGLGAFTKVVGDAGVTVAKQASLPVTTGNSYSASAALWAAHEAVNRLGLADVDDQGRISGKAMVVGATGSIGSVCARLLALASDELWLVSPETAKLLALKHEIERENPRAAVHVAATPDDHLGDMDVIVTATSGAGKRVLDIRQVKPGCVITDVARPLDLSPEDVARRPDVLVIESGEIELPGDVRMRDIGLPPGVVYACMAETVVLALEGRYETFTVGRDIDWAKVKEIYRLGLEHGMKLAAISGVDGVFTDGDFARVRELALAAREADRDRPGSEAMPAV